MSIWDELGIAHTSDIRQIKKAYAAKSKLVHPEEHPDEFRQLHEAYEAAIQYAKSRQQYAKRERGANPDPESQNAFDFSSTQSQSVQTQSDVYSSFDDADTQPIDLSDALLKERDSSDSIEEQQEQPFDFAQVHSDDSAEAEEIDEQQENDFDFQKAIFQSELKRNSQIMELTGIVIRNAEKLYSSKVFDTEMQWLDVFNNDITEQIINEPIFINELCTFLKNHKINEHMANALFKVFHLGSIAGYKDKGDLEELFNLVIDAKAEAINRLDMKIKLCKYFICCSVILLVVGAVLPNIHVAAISVVAFAILIAALIVLKAERKKYNV